MQGSEGKVDLTEDNELKARRGVRDRYAKLAQKQAGEGECCNDSSSSTDVPAEALSVYAGCGSPLTLISPKEGDTVLDLGSGGGIDVFRASKLVGERGKAIGVDATPEMIWRARETARKNGYANVEFRLGEIEAFPIESNSVDYVISNCVINLSPDKQRVFKEAYRVLKPRGVFAVADITSEREIPDAAKRNIELWSSCVSGAISRSLYRSQLELAGFRNVEIKTVTNSVVDESVCCGNDGAKTTYGIQSSHIIARK